MADEENERRDATMDLMNLYLGLPRSPRSRSLELGSDLSLSSLTLPASSYSSEIRGPEATSVEMEASVSQAPHSPSHAFVAEADVPSFGPWQPALEDPIAPCCLAQETEGPSILYSPSNVQVLQIDQVVVEPAERVGEYDALIDEIFEELHFVDYNSAQGDASQTPYSPSYNQASADYHDDENYDTFLPLPSQNRCASVSSSQLNLLLCPHIQIPTLIESHGWRRSSLRQSLSRRSERTDFAPAEVVTSESSEKKTEEKNRRATNFDCNICIDIAKDPVVTSCGHLFCWPCLYQWLHLHSDHKECPVCKRDVIEANITPIYGRGCSRSDIENNNEENSASGLLIPSRPRGKRIESWSQLLTPFYQRFSGHDDALTQSGSIAVERRFQSDVGSVLRDGGTESIPNEINAEWGLHCFPANDSLDAMDSDIGRAIERIIENINSCGTSSSSNARDLGQFVSITIAGQRTAADQASASSTMAVINSESSARDASAEPNSADRRREGSITSGSSDGGGSLRPSKRRRLH